MEAPPISLPDMARDVIGIYNYARCVRGGSSTSSPPQEAIDACNGLSELTGAGGSRPARPYFSPTPA